MSERRIKKPIFIVGAPRSGTTLLARIFAVHPEVAFWEEPRTIWETGNAFRQNDCLTEADETSRIAEKIDRHFSRYLLAAGRSRFAEKTPANSLRVRFIHAIYPDAKIIHVVRNGPESVTSILKMRSRPARPDRIISRLKETPVSEYPALLLRALRRERFLLRPEGWRDFSRDPVEQATQMWKAVVHTSRRDLKILPAESWIEFQYEDFVRDHEGHLAKILDYCELPESEEMAEKANQLVDSNRADGEVSEAVSAAFRKFDFRSDSI